MFELYSLLKVQVLNKTSSLGFAAETEWLTAALAFAVFFIILRLIRWISLKIIYSLHNKADKKFFSVLAEFLENLSYLFDLVLALYLSTLFIHLTPGLEKTINSFFVIIMVIYFVFALRRLLVDFLEAFYRLGKANSEVDKTAIVFFRVLIEGVLWAIALIIVLQSWGYDVSVLLGGLGVAGIIVSLSFQNVLKDVFAFFSIYADKTFKVNDFIKTKDIKGTVREIGLRTTKFKAVGGHEVIVSNRMLVDGVVENFGRLEERQVIMEIVVAIDTSGKKLASAAGLIEDFFNSEPALKDVVILKRAYLMEVSQLGFVYEIVYVVTVADYEIYVKMKEMINLGVTQKFEKAQIKLAGMGKISVESHS